jgi:hemoglobin/transferrin/lactoferrin receptor protein
MAQAKRNIAVLLGSTALAASLAAQAEAQQVNEAEKQGRVTLLQRLVVGAGAEKVAIDTPQAVTVLEQEDIDREQPTTVGDLFDRIPGVTVSGSERVLGETFNIRGVGAPETAGDEGRIIVNVDGAQKFYESYRMGSFFSDPELFKRVEVLRGPASSTLYGSGALGGVINFTTKDAADFLADGQTGAVRLKGAYESNGDGLLGSGILAYRPNEHAEFLLAGNYRQSDAYVTGNGTIIPSSEFAAPSGLAKGTFRFGEANEQVLRLSYSHWTSEADDQQYAQVNTEPFFGTVDRVVTDRTAIISYENPDSDNPWLDLKIQASFSDTTNEQTGASLGGSGSPLFNDTTYGYQTSQFSVQNTFDAEGENWQNFLTFGSQTAYQERSVETVTPLGFHPEGTDFKTGIFVQNEFVWDERLTLIAGVRGDYRELTPDGSVGNTGPSDDTAFSPKLAAHYRFNDTLAVFGSLAHTERFPTLDELYSNDFAAPTPPNFSLDLKKERSNNVEAGFALSGYDLIRAGDSLQLKTTGFYNHVTDYIERFRFGYPQYRNTGEAQIYGAEVELAYESEYIFANAAYSVIRGENAMTGRPLNTIPADELALTLGGKLPDRDLSFGWTGRFVAEQNRVTGLPNSRQPTSGFALHGVFASWKPQDGPLAGLETNFSVENIFDEQYKDFLSNDPGKGRTFKVSLARQFGW